MTRARFALTPQRAARSFTDRRPIPTTVLTSGGPTVVEGGQNGGQMGDTTPQNVSGHTRKIP